MRRWAGGPRSHKLVSGDEKRQAKDHVSNRPQERVVRVEVRPRPYVVAIGPGQLATLGPRLAELVKSRRVAVVTDTNVGPLYADQATASLHNAGLEPTLLTVPAGEATKSLEQVARLYDKLSEAKIDRTSSLVSLGGGVVSDLTGFVAATWLRGIPFASCSTTVEANVDASVGGKTGVNHPSGKNMIGAFHQPLFVLIDTDTLSTLSERDYVAGLAESIKHAVIRDAAFFAWHERNAGAIVARQPEILPELFEHNVRIKAEIVAQDERETSGLRALLNFGHTVGHAIEAAMARRGEPWRHGEAVAVGMVAAAEMSVVSGRLDRPSVDRIVTLLERTGLPVRAPLADARDELTTLMRADKKVSVGKIRFVLVEAIGQAVLCDDVRPSWIAAGLDRVLTTP